MLVQHLSSISCILMMIWWEYFFEREESSSQCRKSNQTTRPTSGLSQKRAAGLLKNTRHWPRFFLSRFSIFWPPLQMETWPTATRKRKEPLTMNGRGHLFKNSRLSEKEAAENYLFCQLQYLSTFSMIRL